MVCSGGINLTGLIPVALDLLDIALTIVGLIPAPVPVAGQVGIATDASTIVLNIISDQPLGTVLSVVSLIPVAGEFAGALKIIYKVSNILMFFMGSPLIQFLIVAGVLFAIFVLYYFIYYI